MYLNHLKQIKIHPKNLCQFSLFTKPLDWKIDDIFNNSNRIIDCNFFIARLLSLLIFILRRDWQKYKAKKSSKNICKLYITGRLTLRKERFPCVWRKIIHTVWGLCIHFVAGYQHQGSPWGAANGFLHRIESISHVKLQILISCFKWIINLFIFCWKGSIICIFNKAEMSANFFCSSKQSRDQLFEDW